jgi:Carbohydrate esterase, sialic acid-specific acetylesterase
MGLTIKHATLSNVQDEGVLGEIGPSEWNEGHTITGAEPIIILATGQSNFTRTPAFTWTPADNCFVWNWDGVDGHLGTAFVAVDSTVMNVARKFASDVAKVNATRSVYLINISFSGQDISHWQTGASAPDVFQNILNNITPALAAIGRTEIDALIWWQGETQTSNPDNYVADWQAVHSRFTGQSWFPRATPVILFGLSPTTISGTVRSDVTNSYLQTIVRSDLDMRMFVYPGTFGASSWEDTVHMTAEGYNRAGKMAANEFVYGPGRNILLDPVTGCIRSNVIGRPTFRNLIIGCDFTTAPWQRGTSFTSVGTTSYTADRWTWVQIGSGVIDIAKTADAPTLAQAGMFTQHCLDIVVTTADVSIAASDVYVLLQRIEGLSSSFLGFGQLSARRITVSFWVKSSKTGTFYVTARNNGNNRTYTTAYTINAADTWEFKSFSIPGDTSGSWLYTNGVGLSLTWTLAAGSNFQGTADTWNGSNVLATSSQANALDTIGNHFKLALVQVEEGVGASPFEQLPQDVVLDRCRRYYRKSFALATAPAQNVGSNVGAAFAVSHVASAVFGGRVEFDTNMRAAPTITTYNPNAANANWRDITNGADRMVTVADASESGFNMTGAAGAAAALNYVHWQAVSEL